MSDTKARAVKAQELQTQDIGKLVSFDDGAVRLAGKLQALEGRLGLTVSAFGQRDPLLREFRVTLTVGGLEREVNGTLAVVIDDGE